MSAEVFQWIVIALLAICAFCALRVADSITATREILLGIKSKLSEDALTASVQSVRRDLIEIHEAQSRSDKLVREVLGNTLIELRKLTREIDLADLVERSKRP